jgi:hypothetical protein
MSDASTPDLAALERRLDVHGMLIRALLTHLAYADPEGLRGLVAGFNRSAAQHPGGPADEAAQMMTTLLEDLAGTLHHH